MIVGRQSEKVAANNRLEYPILLGLALGLAIFYFAPLAPVAVAGLLIYAFFAYVRLDLALLWVIVAAPFYLLPKQFGSLQFSMVEVLVLTCLAVFALRWIVGRGGTMNCAPDVGARFIAPRNRFPTIPILLFLLASILSLLAAERLHEGLRELRTVVVEPVIFYFLLSNVLDRRKVSLLADVLVLSGVAVAIAGLYRYFIVGDVITAEGVFRMRAYYGSPNNLGLYLGRVIPLAFCLGWFGWRGSRSLRAFYIGATLLLLGALAITFSGGAWIAVALSLLLVLAFRNRALFGVAALGVAGLAIALPQFVKLERITSRFDLAQGTSSLRLLIWQAAAKMIQDHPLLGVGLDNFLNQYPRYMLPEAWREPALSHPHNLVLDFWLRTGLLGLAAGAWLLVGFFTAGVRVYRSSSDGRTRAMALGLIAGMLDFVVHGMIDNSYFAVDLAIIFWASLATVRILDRTKEFE